MRDFVDLNELYPLIKEVIESGGEFKFYPRGISMEPLLHQGDDAVALGAATQIGVGDVVLYTRDDGTFVMHRIVGKHRGTYTMCGDRQFALEFGIKPSQICAKMVAFYKKEEYHAIDEPKYIEYAKAKVRRFPFYRRNPIIYSFLSKTKSTLMKIIKKS